MRSLLEQQREFAGALLAGDARLEQYRRNVLGNWAGALASAYPTVRAIVGAEFFEAMARAYGAAHPSRDADLNRFGADFASFAAGFAPAADLPYLGDVARMDWLAHLAWYAADAAAPRPLEAEAFAALPLALAPGCALCASQWPLARIWQIHRPGYAGAMQVDFTRSENIVVYRRGWGVQVSALGKGELRLLCGASVGERFEDAVCAAAAADAAFDPVCAPARWAREGVLTW
ncbi:MAG: HvfC/BufC family peptide modification chaperone [Betaproteobacteria bacterium]